MSHVSRLLLSGFAVVAGLAAGGGSGTALSHGIREVPQDVSGCSVSHRFCYSAPENLGALVNTPQFDGGPSVSADGLTLYLTSGRPGALGQAEGHYDEDLYVATRPTIADAFGVPVHLPAPVNSTQFDVAPEISADGLSLYFVRGPSFPVFDIYLSTRPTTSDAWGSPRPLGTNVNTPFHDGILSISADNRTLYWSSDRPDGRGGFDIWYATRPRPTGEFGPAMNLSELNTPFDDFAPEITANGKVLYFASSRLGGGPASVNIWVSTRNHSDDPFGDAMSLDDINGPVFQAKPSVSNFSEIFWMAVRPGGLGNIDIYRATRRE
jgi:Tol biopolymer transport system component